MMEPGTLRRMACILLATLLVSAARPADAAELPSFLRNWFGQRLPDGIARANGRLEAEEVEIATKFAGRVVEILVAEGDMVARGAVVARMDTAELLAQKRGAEAEMRRMQRSQAQAQAQLAQRESERALAKLELARAEALFRKGYAPAERVDQRRSALQTADAAVLAASAAIDQASAAIETAEATIARLQTQLDDAVLVAPRSGRIEYKLAQAGEVLGAGARVALLLDLTDIYMTVFLPASAAGRVVLGDEARLVLDPAPQWIIPAKVEFVASDAQFTPKAVETADEREKLMFRIKLRIEPSLLERYAAQAKTGVRGVGYVRTRCDAAWPAELAVRLPP